MEPRHLVSCGTRGVGSQPPTFNSQPSQRGIALVITLILLSVTLVMAIAFLAISRRERNSVTTTTDAATAKLAADSALAHAEAQIIANVFATTNPYNFGLLVSTNFINTNGFVAAAGANPTNVSYTYNNGAPLITADTLQNLANLLYSPRPPVFIVTNSQTGATDFRFYLDLNQNGLFDDTSINLPNVQIVGGLVVTNGTISEVGDPQWIGQLARPDAPHGPNNFFVARYAFFAAPAGNTLDLNAIHNQVFNQGLGTADGFFRNQGVGSWEINLAAFLADLNTNEWGQVVGSGSGSPVGSATYYQYNQMSSANSGHAFEDARALLAYRYNTNYNSLSLASALFPNNALAGAVDIYPLGLMTNTAVPFYSYLLNNPWPGADNTNHYFHLSSDLFDATKVENNVTPPGFIDRLTNASAGISTYDRYTFYRLLSQLGTDSEPEQGKINLNYANVDANGNIVPNAETNLVPWTPVQFFTIAADRLLRTYTTNWFQANPTNFLATYYGVVITNNYYYTNPDGSVLTNDPTGLGLTEALGIPNVLGLTNDTIPAFSITNIPVLVYGQFVYSSAVNRLLQLAANIYDASTNRYYDNFTPLPTVFRPFFNKVITSITTNVYICGFNEVTNVNEPDFPLSQPFDLKREGPPGSSSLADLVTTATNHINVFGVPLIIGAKKGLPNFNQFAMQSIFFIVRDLQITRTSTNALPSTYQISQQFQCGITNQLAVELWNSYATNYALPTDIFVTNWLTMNLTNDEGYNSTANITPIPIISGYTNLTSGWPGYNSNSAVFSMQMPLNTNVTFLPGSVYVFNGTSPYFTNNVAAPFETNVNVPGSITPQYPQPHWWLMVTNNIQVAMVDHNTQRLIDYVQLSGPTSTRDVTSEILSETNYQADWLTNPVKPSSLTPPNLPSGIYNEIDNWAADYSLTKSTLWGNTSQVQAQYQIDGLRNFYHDIYLGRPVNHQASGSTNLSFGVTMNPTIVVRFTTWQANDPLVHYIASDLNDTANDTGVKTTVVPLISTSVPNERYQPWSRSVQMNQEVSPDFSARNLAIKDPLVWQSDNWDFPTYQFPTVGWLGRVHRGTPWQTVYLKASPIDSNSWVNWTGNLNLFDATNTLPKQDRLLFDVFSTALNDNATRGQLSVNVGAPNGPSFAAWSALFSGITVPTSLTNTYTVINPAGSAGTNSPLGQLVVAINNARADTNFVNTDGLANTFEHVGDILRAPQLTEQSPFILSTLNPQTEVSDELYEWLPQQAMSLLRCPTAPRYVVYCYGQTLKPAQNSLVTGGSSFFGMCTNYQIVSEAVVRAVIRVDDANTSHPRAVIESYNLLPPD